MSLSVEFGSADKDRFSIAYAQGKVAPEEIDSLYDPRMEIHEWIIKARERAELTQGQLAEALSITRGNVSAWENKRHEPSLSQIKMIATVCRADPKVLFDESNVLLLQERRDGMPSAWPFSFSQSMFDNLPELRKREAELILRGLIAEWHDRRSGLETKGR